eukprot:11037079-Heterocapsa_arctica.AAC.1
MIKSALDISCAMLGKRGMKEPEKGATIINDSRGVQIASPAETHREQGLVGLHLSLDEQERAGLHLELIKTIIMVLPENEFNA